jgi:putative ABC transport system ATP-binding protein
MTGQQQGPFDASTGLLACVWRLTRWQQVWLLVVVLLSLPTYFLAFDLPRRIINGPIQGAGFATPDSTTRLLPMTLSWPGWLGDGGSLSLFAGFEVTRFGALIGLSLMFLALIAANGLFKFYINTYKGKLGERVLRRLRFELIDRLLRFPVRRVRSMKAAEAASIVKDETEPLGPFIGDAFVQPLYLGGQAATALAFILVQDLWLGLMAAGIVAAQVGVMPRLRRRLITLGRERQLTARQLAGRVGEIVENIPTIRVNGLTHYERADISSRLGRIYWIRFDIYQWKFLVKFLNNFLAQTTPFLFYVVGGTLVLRGQLDVGQLVAVIAAYRDLPTPLKELMDWDQQRLDAEVKLAQVMEQFAGDDLVPAQIQAPAATPIARLVGPIEIANLDVSDETGAKLLDRASLTLPLDARVAVLSEREQEAEALADAVARLLPPSQGRISIDKTDLAAIPEAITGRRFAYVGPTGFFPQASLRDSLLYVLKQAPVREAVADGARRKAREREIAEARRTENSLLDIAASWVDHAGAGASDEAELMQRIREVARITRLEEDIIAFGLLGIVDPDTHPDLAAAMVAARASLSERMQADDLAGLVENFSANAYHWQSTIGENLLFGAAIDPALQPERLVTSEHLRDILARSGLEPVLYELGRTIAATTVEMFEDLPENHPFFAELTFMRADAIGDYRSLLRAVEGKPLAQVARQDRDKMIRLALAYVEPRHRMSLIDGDLAARIVNARTAFLHGLPAGLRAGIEFYDAQRYVRAASLLDNMLFGRIVSGIAGAPQRVLAAIRALLRELNLDDMVFAIGLEFDLGSGARRLTLAQRQKLEVARALLKRADYLIMNRPLEAVNAGEFADILRDVLAHSRDPQHPFGVLWTMPPQGLLPCFDQVAVLEHGAVASFGPPPAEDVAKKGRRAAHVAQR